VLGVVALSGGLGASVQGGVEVASGAVFADTGRHQPHRDFAIGLIAPDRSAPALHLDLEQNDVVDRSNALVRGVGVGELLAGLMASHLVV
jgi:hypothetical protein